RRTRSAGRASRRWRRRCAGRSKMLNHRGTETQRRQERKREIMVPGVRLCFLWSSLCLCASVVPSPAAEPWATYRGNPERTGCTPGRPGPAAPRVLWALKSQENFIAAPVPLGDRVFVSGLGAFNVATFRALLTDPKAAERAAWTKTTPYLKLPTVSSPAV